MREGRPYYIGDTDKTIDAPIVFDWKARTDEILELIDAALKDHGLTLETHETESDFYALSIVKDKK